MQYYYESILVQISQKVDIQKSSLFHIGTWLFLADEFLPNYILPAVMWKVRLVFPRHTQAGQFGEAIRSVWLVEWEEAKKKVAWT